MAKKGLIFLEKVFTSLDLLTDVLDLDIPNEAIRSAILEACLSLKDAYRHFGMDVSRSLSKYTDEKELPF